MEKLKEILFLKNLKGVGKSFIYNKFWNQLQNSSCLEDIVDRIRYATKLSESDIEEALKKTEDLSLQLEGMKDVKTFTVFDDAYPERLKVMKDKRPLLLYVKGNVDALNSPNIAIIGTRNPSEWSQKVEPLLTKKIINVSDRAIVSGLALGCDRIAHGTTLSVGGQTIAVLPSGFNEITPPSHKDLAEDIVRSSGCIVSEYEPDTKPNNGTYIERDALIAALSDVTLAVEFGVKSGTVHALDYANAYKRIVGCYMPEDRAKGDYSGNEYYIKDKGAVKVSDTEALLHLLEESKKTSSDSDDEEETQQMSLFDVDGFSSEGTERKCKSQNGVYYLHEYYPIRFKEHKGISEDILRFKDNDEAAVIRFSKELKKEIESILSLYRDETKFANIVITIMPSHYANKWGQALETVSHLLAKGFGMIDGTRMLVRYAEHDRLSTGGERTVESHLNTVRIDPRYQINGKTVIILDDVTTTGNSLKAATKILTQNGARKVYPIAIGRTMLFGTLKEDYRF